MRRSSAELYTFFVTLVISSQPLIAGLKETLKHRNRSIGYLLGNDFDSTEFGVSAWVIKGLKILSALTFIRDGEGGIDVPFSTPWTDVDEEGNFLYTVERGYPEPFPTGVVQEITEFKFSAERSFSSKFIVTFDYEHIAIDNSGHVVGISKGDDKFFLRMWYDFKYSLNL